MNLHFQLINVEIKMKYITILIDSMLTLFVKEQRCRWNNNRMNFGWRETTFQWRYLSSKSKKKWKINCRMDVIFVNLFWKRKKCNCRRQIEEMMELSPLIYCCEIFVVLTASHLVSPDGIFTSSHPWGFAFFRAAYRKTKKLAWGRLPCWGGGSFYFI